MGAYFSVNTGLTRRAPDDTLDPPDAQAGTSVRGQQQAARPTAEIGLKQLPQVGREEDGLSPHRVVIARLFQCVPAHGVVSRVGVSTWATGPSVIVRGAPGRRSSRSRARHLVRNRCRPLGTVSSFSRSSRATTRFALPAAHASTMPAPCANACAVVRRRVSFPHRAFAGAERKRDDRTTLGHGHPPLSRSTHGPGCPDELLIHGASLRRVRILESSVVPSSGRTGHGRQRHLRARQTWKEADRLAGPCLPDLGTETAPLGAGQGLSRTFESFIGAMESV